ncbi:probable polygalacturonase At1g80170 [Punica granatum]|uniref:Probable polygalacturonase At1g80170 n=1 Tax=Punica granatum TaxID=22663 RepID=A0A6P8CLE1_PUNGR|nr:probable polygalacturonase At1g80170 [Punica granatum]
MADQKEPSSLFSLASVDCPLNGSSKISQILGNMIAPDSPESWSRLDPSRWLSFRQVEQLHVTGFGTIDGRGEGMWNQSCRYHPHLQLTDKTFYIVALGACSGRMHFPGTNCDDCVSIGDYTSNIHISSSICGPGHGVSIGSLGRSGNVVQVEDIHVGTGYVRRVTFEDIKLDSVQNPIIINQSCCQTRGACEEKHSGVHISNVTYNDLSGTSSTNVAINFNRSRSIACTGIVLKSINLTSAKPRGRVTSSCTNAYGNVIGGVQPKPCLLVAKITA